VPFIKKWKKIKKEVKPRTAKPTPSPLRFLHKRNKLLKLAASCVAIFPYQSGEKGTENKGNYY
jgi:hypothetical protein